MPPLEAQLMKNEIVVANTDRYIALMLDNYRQAERQIIDEMNRIYAKHLSGVDPEGIYNTMIQYNRLGDLLSRVHDQYRTYAGRAGQQIPEIAESAFRETYYRQQFLFDWYRPQGINLVFTRLDDRFTKLIVTGNFNQFGNIEQSIITKYGDLSTYTPPYGTLSDVISRTDTNQLVALNQQITQGFIMGKTIDEMVADIQSVMQNSEYFAERIARTEATRCMNTADYLAAVDAQQQGIELGRIWQATLDRRTRDAHAELDGKRVGMDEPFEMSDGDSGMFPGDFSDPGNVINCRCTVVYEVDGERPQLRRTEDGVGMWQSYEQWAAENGITAA